MKKQFTVCCLLSAIIIFQSASAQKSVTPCCSILSIGPVDALTSADPVGPVDAVVTAQNNTTGQTFQFKPDALDFNNLHVGDAINVNASMNKITSIKGVERRYPINEPNPGQPCCGITNIHPDPAAPCCNVVNIQDNGITYSFSVPKNISSKLKTGQPVSLAMQNSYAVFKTNISGWVSTYSYPVQNSTSTENSNQVWEIKLDTLIKGMGGEITLKIPKELRYNTHMEFYDTGNAKKLVASWFGNNKAKLLPGLYNIVVDKKYTIQNVPVELGKQTRLKMGVFIVSSYGSFEIENVNHQKFTYAPPFKILLPEGKYYLNKNKKVPIVIKDGELTEL